MNQVKNFILSPPVEFTFISHFSPSVECNEEGLLKPLDLSSFPAEKVKIEKSIQVFYILQTEKENNPSKTKKNWYLLRLSGEENNLPETNNFFFNITYKGLTKCGRIPFAGALCGSLRIVMAIAYTVAKLTKSFFNSEFNSSNCFDIIKFGLVHIGYGLCEIIPFGPWLISDPLAKRNIYQQLKKFQSIDRQDTSIRYLNFYIDRNYLRSLPLPRNNMRLVHIRKSDGTFRDDCVMQLKKRDEEWSSRLEMKKHT